MHIGMAVDAFGFSIGKHKGCVAGNAVRFRMAPCEGKRRGIVVKGVDCFIQLPAVGTVANVAAYFKLVSMRGICGK